LSTPIPIGVVGVGFQGRRHAQKLQAIDAAELVAVIDTDPDCLRSVTDELGVDGMRDHRDLVGRVSAAVVATPTSTHFEIARDLLRAGIHVLIEKPLATRIEEARMLVEIADRQDLVLQVGHLERFNPVVVKMAEYVTEPEFIESNRIAPFKPRGLDVSVVLDLMIHDIDLIHSFVRSPIAHVDAVGRSVFTENTDVANARITFTNGCVANVTSSRISLKTERTLRIFQPHTYLSGDLQLRTLAHFTTKGDGPVTGPDDVCMVKKSFGNVDALVDQACAFLRSVAGGPRPVASGRVALDTLETATEIISSCLASRSRRPHDTRLSANR
jgi:predicted dehydrogenase